MIYYKDQIGPNAVSKLASMDLSVPQPVDAFLEVRHGAHQRHVDPCIIRREAERDLDIGSCIDSTPHGRSLRDAGQ